MGLFSSENLERAAWLAGGAIWLGLGGGPEACVAMGAAATGIAGSNALAIRKDLLKTSPDTVKAIGRIQKDFKNQLDRQRYGRSDKDDEALEDIDDVLAELIFDNWPSPRRIAELATKPDGFPEAVACDVIERIASRAETYGHLKPEEEGGNAAAYDFAIDVVTAVMNAAAAEDQYFKTIQPHLVFEGLECLGDVKRATARIEAGQTTLCEVLEIKMDVQHQENLDEHSKTQELIRQLLIQQSAQTDEAPVQLDPSSEQALIKSIEGLLTASEGARKRAGDRFTQDPPDLSGALIELKQLAAEQEEATADNAQTYRDIGSIAFLTDNTQEALSAWLRVTQLAPTDADAFNQLGHLYRRIGELTLAQAACESVLELGDLTSDKALIAVANGNLGIIEQTRGNLDGAENYYNQALGLNKELGRKEGMASNYGNLGIIEKTRGNLNGACSYWRHAYDLFADIGMKPQVEQTLALMREVSCELPD